MLKWLIKKPLSMLCSKITPKYSIHKYPPSIKAIYHKIDSEIKNNYVLDGKFYEKDSDRFIKKILPSITIPLASHKHKYININWFESFQDQEDEMSLHRWNWLLHIISDEDYDLNKVAWAHKQIENWIKLFSNELINNDYKITDSLRWSSYTVGERISNSILFHYFTNTAPSRALQKTLLDQLIFLSKRLEYFGSRTGNHIINNSRALFLYGIAFDDINSTSVAKEIIYNDYTKLVSIDGFLREGSSHYQFLFTRWIGEIYFFSLLSNDLEFTKLIKKYLIKLLSGCKFFHVNNSKESRIIPLIGDISPDCKPEWLIDIDKCKIINGNYLEGPNLRDSWNNLFNNIDTDKFPKIINKNYINNNNNLFPDSGWYKFNHGRFILFIRQDKKGFPNHVGHHHQDFGHFVLFIDNHEFIIDIGRKNYINKNGVFPNFHNTVQVDGLGVIPKYPHRYPHKYSQFSNTLDYDQKNGKINIKISTDGFTRLNKKNCWERTLVLKENEFTINDMIIGFNKKSKISANFYFSDKILLNKTRNNKINISSDSISGLFESDNIGTNIDLIKANRYKIYGKQNDCTLLRYNYDLKNHSSIKYKIKLS